LTDLPLYFLGSLALRRGVEATLQRSRPAVDVADGLEAHRNVAHDEGDAIPPLVHHSVQKTAQVGEHDLRVRLVKLVVVHGQHREDALGHGHRVASARGGSPRPDVNHVVRVGEELRHIPRGKREDAELVLTVGQLGDGLHGAELLVGTLAGHEEDALPVERVLQDAWPEDAHGFPAARLPDDVAVRAPLLQ
jgi:hypothetical protein